MKRVILLAWVLGLSSAYAEPVIEPRPEQLPGVTTVTEDPHVTVTMGLKMAPTNDPGDSVEWWERRQAGWRRWSSARKLFPRLQSKWVDSYLAAVAEGFNRTLPLVPRTRYHFYVADSLNPSIWPVGGGFFVIHGGIFRQMKDERQFAFLLALELAHEVLGHNFQEVRAGDIKWEPGRWRKGDFDGWPVEFWAYLVGRDPIDRGGFEYTLQQESDALELVYRFFRANLWDYEGVNMAVADFLPTLNNIPGASSLPRMHSNLKMAVQLPHAKPRVSVISVDPIAGRSTYALMLSDMNNSTLQKYPWMLELVPYRQLVIDSRINVEQLREGYGEHADIVSKKFDSARRKPRKQSFSSDVSEIEELDEMLDERAKITSARLARLYLKGFVLLGHHRWNEVLANSEEGLKIDTTAEPFLWQRALARQQLGQFNKCITEMQLSWRFFDHRRQLLMLECSFLEGRFTDAEVFANDYRRKYPFDIDGAFWQTLTALRLHRTVDSNLKEIEAFWGDRPLVRALKIFNSAYIGKFLEAKEAIEFKSDIRYDPEEWGVFEFAQAWLRETFSEIHDDDRADKLRKLADLQWPLAHLVRYNLPREAVQNR